MGPIAVVLDHTTATAPHDNKDLALLEVGEQRQVGFSALLVCAEKVTEFDEFVPQGDGPQVVRDDPRAKLLDGEAWEQVRPTVLASLNLPGEPGEHLAARAALLDGTYREVAARVPVNSQIVFDDDDRRLHFAAPEPEPEPVSLLDLRKAVEAMMPCPVSTCRRCWRCSRGSAPTPRSPRSPAARPACGTCM
ncbi:hypothetical protein AMK22_35305 [Streptomyces sp. CB01580]|nr:hypothetical protein [Streptomyces sp. CB01580]OKJ19352.1 hypothetical protein AMK22_35305 [Streptomyces sp. CB01580]